jgi:hypothetical protein
MTMGLPGADSSNPVTAEMVQGAQQLFGATPAFWGRYFTSAGTTGSVEYRHATEDPVLAQFGIRLLPIARQTTHVGGSSDQGISDAEANVGDLFATFPLSDLAAQGGQFLLFLDVEGNPVAGSPSLSLDYFLGWGKTLVESSQSQSGGTVTIQPCVYARQGDTATWNVLAAASVQGVSCQAGWSARYYSGQCALSDWDDAIVLPSVQLPFPILIWQYAENCCDGAIDANQTNPEYDIQSLLISKLIRPPGSIPAAVPGS